MKSVFIKTTLSCYEIKSEGPPPQAAVRALCFIKSNVSIGVFGADNLKTCKSEARNLGQYVKVSYYDFETKSETIARVFEN